MAKFPSQFPVTTTLVDADIMLVDHTIASVLTTCQITVANAKLTFQPRNSNLDQWTGLTPTQVGSNFATLSAPATFASYMKVSPLGNISYFTIAQTIADLAVPTLIGPQAMTNTKISGLSFGVGTSPTGMGLTTITDVPANPFFLYLIGISPQTGTTLTCRTTAPSDVVFPVSGTLATVANTIPLSYLNTNIALSPATDGYVPTNLAVQTYVNARIGNSVKITSDDTLASSATLNLDSVTGPQTDITGTVPITGITLTSGERVIKFTGSTTVTPGGSLVTPGNVVLNTTNGSWATVRGGGTVTVLNFQKGTSKVADIDGGTIKNALVQSCISLSIKFIADATKTLSFISNEVVPANANLDIRLLGADRIVVFGGGFGIEKRFNINGAFTTDLYVTAATALTLPVLGTLATGISNFSTTAQTPAAATRTYITGSAFTIPTSKIQIGTMFTWKFNMTKTAAGSASSTFDICVGTTGTTADTARVSFTKPAGTAASDEGWVVIEAEVRGPLSASGIMVGEFIMYHNGNTTGHATIPIVVVNTVSGTFDVTTAGLFVGVCITSGAADAITIQQVMSKATNI